MKTSILIRNLCCAALLYVSGMPVSFGQCSATRPPQTIAYDTLLYGGSSAVYNIDFPKFDTSAYSYTMPGFDPSKGTLVRVELQTVITVRCSYTLENNNVVPVNFKIKMSREDMISSSALPVPADHLLSKIVASPTLYGTDSTEGSGPDYTEGNDIYAYNKYPFNYNYTSNLAGFLGNGNVSFNYESITDFYPNGTQYNWNPTTHDSIYFKLVYFYCPSSALPAGITGFAATRQSTGNINLSWFNPNENKGNRYVIEKSADAATFTETGAMLYSNTAASNHQVTYKPGKDDARKIFFRLKEYTTDGAVKYTNIVDVSLPETAGVIKVYPSVVADRVNIYFPGQNKDVYQVKIVSTTGQVMQQTDFPASSLLKVVFTNKMPAGLYLVEAVNKRTRQSHLSKIVVQ